MEMKILTKKQEPLLSRLSVNGEIEFDSKTPSKDELRKAMVSQLKADEKMIVIKQIDTAFGARKATFHVLVYDDEKSMAAAEPRPKKKKEAAAAPAN